MDCEKNPYLEEDEMEDEMFGNEAKQRKTWRLKKGASQQVDEILFEVDRQNNFRIGLVLAVVFGSVLAMTGLAAAVLEMEVMVGVFFVVLVSSLVVSYWAIEAIVKRVFKEGGRKLHEVFAKDGRLWGALKRGNYNRLALVKNILSRGVETREN